MDKVFIEIFEELAKLNASGKYTAFFSFAGHTRTIDIRIYIGKWSKNRKPNCELCMIHYESPKYEYYDSNCLRKVFNPQTFLNYLDYLCKIQSTKKCQIVSYSEYDK